MLIMWVSVFVGHSSKEFTYLLTCLDIIARHWQCVKGACDSPGGSTWGKVWCVPLPCVPCAAVTYQGQSLMCTIALCAMCCGDLPGAKSDVYHCRVCGVCCADVAQTASTSSRSARALCMTSTCVCSAKTPSNIHWRRRRRRRPVAARTGRRGCRMRWCLRSPSFASRWFTSCRRTVSEWVSFTPSTTF